MSSGGVRAVAFATLLGVALVGSVAEARLPVCGGGGTTGQNTITSASITVYSAANSGQDVTFSGTAQSDAKGVTVKLNNSVTGSTTLPGSSSQQNWSVTIASSDFATLADGPVVAAAAVQLTGSTVDAGSLTITKNVTPPGNVQNLTGTGGDGQVVLTWTNPTNSDFATTRVLQSTSGFATSPSTSTGQTIAFEGSAATATITGLTASTTYFFTAFARDSAGNWSSTGATAQATTSGATPTPTPTPTPPPTNVSFSDNFDACTSSSDLGSKWTTAGIWYCRSGKARGESAATLALANTAVLGNTDVTARLQPTSSSGNAGLTARANGSSYYAARILVSGKVQVIRVVGTTTTVLGEANATIKIEPSSQRLRFRVTGTTTVALDVWLDGAQVLSVQDTSSQRLQTGQGGLYNGASSRTQFDDFSLVTP